MLFYAKHLSSHFLPHELCIVCYAFVSPLSLLFLPSSSSEIILEQPAKFSSAFFPRDKSNASLPFSLVQKRTKQLWTGLVFSEDEQNLHDNESQMEMRRVSVAFVLPIR